MKRSSPERDQLLDELQSRFKDGFFQKSEYLNRNKKDGIFIAYDSKDNQGLLIVTPNATMHPDFEVIMDKYEAWLEPTHEELGFWIFIKNDLRADTPKFNFFRTEFLKALKAK